MITSTYRGGLGNQMFQVASGISLAMKNNTDYKINPSLQIELGDGKTISNYIHNIFKNIPTTTHKGRHTYTQTSHLYEPLPYCDDILLDGYFQSEKYFHFPRPYLTSLFGFSQQTHSNPTAALQIRAGDYLRLSDFKVVTPRYFANAIDYIHSTDPGVEYHIITNDLSYARDLLPRNITTYHNYASEIDHLRFMSKCDYCVISNSSFGWWGSYLGCDKTTISPNKWTNTDKDFSDLYRSDMLRYEV